MASGIAQKATTLLSRNQPNFKGISYWNLRIQDLLRSKDKICWLLNRTHQLIGPWEIWMRFQKYNFHSCFTDGIFRFFHDIALRWMPWDLTDDESTLVHVMAWCCQATSHYLNPCWFSSMASLDHHELIIYCCDLIDVTIATENNTKRWFTTI